MHILFLTTSNLSSNPRLVKEIRLALLTKSKVTVVLFDLKQWTTELEREYQQEFKEVELLYLPITRNSLFKWLQANLVHTCANKVYRFFPSSLKVAAFASDKRSFLLNKKLRSFTADRFDIVISHNLGALYPAFNFSLKNRIPFAFDVEDYHPGETIYKSEEVEKIRRERLMRELLPKAVFVTAASPHIGSAVEELCDVKVTTINNSFYSSEFSVPELSAATNINNTKLNFVWFSQNINYGRGLELLLPALDDYRKDITLTLIGNLKQNFADALLAEREYINVLAPMNQNKLHKKLSLYDVGLALEVSSTDYNKEIALSNKIFAYKQAGLFILATNTKAQTDFMKQFVEDGVVCEQTKESFKDAIRYIKENISVIRASKFNRYNKAKEIAFESEAQKLVALWQKAVLQKA